MHEDLPDLAIGIVGLGTHGRHYADHIRALGGDHELVGVDADPEARETFAERYGAETHDQPAALADAGVDAAIVATPTKFHEPAALGVFEAGLDALIEKPLAHDVESAQRIAAAAEREDLTCMVGFQHRFRNPCRILKSYVEEGYLGDLSHVDATYRRRRGVPGRGTWYTSREIAGGGVVMDLGSHAVDMVMHLLDWPDLAAVNATTRSEFGPREDYAYLHMWGEDGEARLYDVEDAATAFLEFEDGTSATVEVAWATNAESAHTYEVRGTEAGALVDVTNTLHEIEPEVDERNDLELYEVRDAGANHFVNSEVVCNDNDPILDELRAFFGAVVEDERPPLNDVQQALAVQEVVDEIYREAGE